jgi:hypothetical protein
MDDLQKQRLIAELTAHREQLIRAAERLIADFSRLVDNAAAGYVAVIDKIKQS